MGRDLTRLKKVAERARALDPLSSTFIKVIAELRALGKHSFREIGEGLTARGIHPPKAAKWRPSLVRAIEMGGSNDNGKN